MAYTTIDNPELYFNTILYTGNDGASQAQTGVGFSADLTWIKDRDNAEEHVWTDTVRGATYWIRSNATNASASIATLLKSWESDGFTVGNNGVVGTTDAYVAWNWKAGGSPSSNSDGAIATSRSLSTTAGFSIMKYTGSGSGSNIAHGLGATPDLIIRKNITGTEDWYVHSILIDGSHDYFKLNTAAAKADSGLTASTSTLIYTAADSADHIVYAFKSIQGYSKFGLYTGGNADADGPIIYTGFKPAFVLIKITAISAWIIHDNKRPGYNQTSIYSVANTTVAEPSNLGVDFLANGFKIRDSDSEVNHSGGSYIYAAFAEAPLVNSNGVPCNAR
tara:strand:+ start:139 stop:1140 length:1002 start_codon:yes stop_codon:yes gene_type:complete